MKTVRIFPKKEDPNFPFSVVLLATPVPLQTVHSSSSFDLTICFLEDGKVKEGKLTLLTKSPLGDLVHYFAYLIVDDECRRQVTVCCYSRKDALSEIWMTILEPSPGIQKYKINVTRTEFIAKAKEYYEGQGMSFTEDGNSTEAIPRFHQNISEEGRFDGKLQAIITGPELHLSGGESIVGLRTVMYKDIFPLMMPEERKGLYSFFKWLDENHIVSCSLEEIYVKEIELLRGDSGDL